MKLSLSTFIPAIAISAALTGVAPAVAGAAFSINFEKAWDYTNGDINGYYGGGTAADGTTGASNLGVSFVNVSGLSNDANFTYYRNAPSPLGIAYASGAAFMNVAAGVENALRFFYSSESAVLGAVKAYSGLNGSGTLLGTFNAAQTGGSFSSTFPQTYQFDGWASTTFSFAGTARSFDLSGAADGNVAFDNISAVPEPSSVLMMLAGGLMVMAQVARRRK